MGNSMLISAELNNILVDLEQFYKAIGKKYNVTLFNRKCDFVEKEIIIINYFCFDVFGKDINRLFLNDVSTNKLG